MEKISQSVVKKDHAPKMSGRSVYVGDIDKHGVLCGKLLRSKLARAKLLEVKVPELPDGYVYVDRNDVPGDNNVNIVMDDTPVYARETVEYIGEPIGMVCGPDEAVCEEILSKIDVVYEELEPVPGDDIVGFITKGYGVSIHRRDCRNAAGASDPKQAGRWVKVAWSTEDKPFSTTFEIDSTDRSGIWLDIATALSAAKLKVTELSGRDMPTGKARTVATFEVRNVQELETIRTKIRAIDGVIDVRRGQN